MEKLLRYYGRDLQEIDFEPWLEQKPQELHDLARKWHQSIQQCGMDVNMIFHDNYPIGCVEDVPFAYVNVFSNHMNLGFFHGADLPDPTQILIGTGKRMRHIKMKPDNAIDEVAAAAILQHAYLDIKTRLMNPS